MEQSESFNIFDGRLKNIEQKLLGNGSQMSGNS